MRALSRRNIVVQPFKSGPDYIDRAFHTAATSRESVNLDTWAMSKDLIFGLINEASRGANIIIAEGAMGLFDGAATKGQSGFGTVADLAALTGWPVLLVLDVARQAQTAVAITLGCKHYRDDIDVAGVFLNRIASPRHESLIRSSMDEAGIAIVGAIPRDNDLTMPERHLGLVQVQESSHVSSFIDRLADAVEICVDLDHITAFASCHQLPDAGPTHQHIPPPPGERIALAQDDAFSFVYPHVIDGWRTRGAAIVPFSPLANEKPDAAADAIWLPGGYPELHAEKIANATTFKGALHRAAQDGVKIHGECGGYMVLGQYLEAENGHRHEMTGLLSHATSFAHKKLHLGYRHARLVAASALGPANTNLFGHEFHYATLADGEDEPLAEIFDANGKPLTQTGSRRGSVSGTFFHVLGQTRPT